MVRWSWPFGFPLRVSTTCSVSRNMRRPKRKLKVEALEARLAPATLQAVSLADPSLYAISAGAHSSTPPSVSADGRFVAFESASSNLVPGDNNSQSDVFVRDVQSGTTTLVSVTPGGTSGNAGSLHAAMTPDGRYVAFESRASDLTADATAGFDNVFVRDLQTGTTTLASVNSSGAGGGDNDSSLPQITLDGRYVVFQSSSGNLVPGMTIHGSNFYVRDRVANTTTLVTINTAGTDGTGIGTSLAFITPDGRYVAFDSPAANLVSGFGDGTHNNVYVRDLVAGQTIPVSVAISGGSGNDSSFVSSISDNGRYATFESYASNLVNGDNNKYEDVFQRDLAAGTTSLVSVNLAGVSGNNPSVHPSVSSDGRYVAFESAATDLVSGTLDNTNNVFVRDLVAGTTALVSENSSGTGSAKGFSERPVMSRDGSAVAFVSNATDLVNGMTVSSNDLFLRNLTSGTTSLVSVNASGTGGGNHRSADYDPGVSANGSFVAFGSDSTNLVNGVLSGLGDVYLRNLPAASTTLVSARDPSLPSVTGNGESDIQSPFNRTRTVSDDGRYVVFTSFASNLVPGDNNGALDVFVRDTQTGTTTLVSVNQSGTGSGNDVSFDPTISADGRYVAFTSAATDLVSSTISARTNVFVRDLVLGTTTLVSVDQSGTGSGNNSSFSPIISPDGRYVAFSSAASDLVANDSYQITEAFIRDLVAQTTTLVGVNLQGVSSAFGSTAAALSADGRYVVFTSYSTDLVPGDTNNQGEVYVRDMVAGTTQMASVSSTGEYANDLSYAPVLTPDGRYVAFASYASNLAPGDTNGQSDVFVRDLQASTTTLASVNNTNTGAGNGSSQDPVISDDGRYAAFDSSSSDLVANDTNNSDDVFVRDLVQGTTTLVSVNNSGTASGNGPSDFPAISADGRYVSFTSYANDLVTATTSLSNVYERDLSAATTTLVSPNNNSDSQNGFLNNPTMTPDGQHIVFESAGNAMVSGDFNESNDVFLWSNGQGPAPTTTAGTLSASPTDFGQPLTIIATVTANPPASGTPTGSVDFFDTTTATDLGRISLSGGSASLSTATLPVGSQTITVSYSGDTNFLASSGTVTVTVVPSIYVLNTTVNAALNLLGSADITIPGLVQVDSSAPFALEAQGNAQVQAGSIQVVGGFGTRGKATLSPAPVTGVASVPDPLAGLLAPTGGVLQGSVSLAAGSLTINPGIYKQITVSGTGSLTLNPGIYVVAGGGLTVTGSGSLTGSGVLIYNAGSNYVGFGSKFGAINLVGQGTISLTPASTGPYAGILIFQSRDNSQAIGLSASSALALQGSILYAPAALLTVTGNALIENAFIVDRLRLGVSAGGVPQLAFQTNASLWRGQSSASGETTLYRSPFAQKAGSLVGVLVASQSSEVGVSEELAKLVITAAKKAHHARLVEQLFEPPGQDGLVLEG